MRALIAALLIASPAFAADWTAMSGAEIAEVLTDSKWDYGGAWQDFRASGRTLYNAGEDSWGYWEVRGDKYCSNWPPAGGWACYAMEMKNRDMIRFVGESGDITEGQRIRE